MFKFLKNRLVNFIDSRFAESIETLRKDAAQRAARGTVDTGTQLSLMLEYKSRLQLNAPPLRLQDVEFRNYSQAGEDGILLYLFSLIGFGNRYCVDFGAGDGLISNVANLIFHHGFYGFLVDAEESNIRRARKLFESHPSSLIYPPKFKAAYITHENVNELLRDADVPERIDLLSIDIDSIDYWVLKALKVVTPRIIVLEYNNLWGADEALTVPCVTKFTPEYLQAPGGLYSGYCGATLKAFAQLLEPRGYRLVGVERYCFNAFFVLEDECPDILPRVAVSECFDHPMCRYTHEKLLPKVKAREWQRV